MASHKSSFGDYADRLQTILASYDWSGLDKLAAELFDVWKSGRNVFLAGNGGSGANANHIANDFIYPVSKRIGSGLRVRSLCDNPATLTCLANDEGYVSIFAAQLSVLANPGDVLIVLSGSGNSPNILRALDVAAEMKVTSFAILGFDGGKALSLADNAIHFEVWDMQIAEDLQMIVFNMILQHLFIKRDEVVS